MRVDHYASINAFIRELTMRPIFWRLLFAVTGLVLTVGPARAITCYTIYDRNNNAIYQDTYTPIDLSEKCAAAWESLNRRGEHLVWADTGRCPTIVFFTGANGSSDIRVDDIVGGLPVRTISGNAARAAAASEGIPAGKTPTGFRSPDSGNAAAGTN
jgi:hypothetical protein